STAGVLVAVSSFFFQAEDGIRDWSVTGVQTCALPILVHRSGSTRRTPGPIRRVGRPGDSVKPRCGGGPTRPDLSTCSSGRARSRSEERRVGEEWRWRGCPYQYTKRKEKA